MSRPALLDVNVLVAVFNPDIHHDARPDTLTVISAE